MEYRTPVTAKELLEKCLEVIQQAIDFIAVRNRLETLITEAFGSYVMLRFIEDDCRRIRQFRGESRFETYLSIVVHRLFLDFRSQHWGQWRSSARARPRRGHVGASTLNEVPDWIVRLKLSESERRLAAARCEAALCGAARELSAKDRLILKLRFVDGCTFKEIARVLRQDEQALHPCLQDSLHRLRTSLDGAGFHRTEARVVWLERIDIDLESALGSFSACADVHVG